MGATLLQGGCQQPHPVNTDLPIESAPRRRSGATNAILPHVYPSCLEAARGRAVSSSPSTLSIPQSFTRRSAILHELAFPGDDTARLRARFLNPLAAWRPRARRKSALGAATRSLAGARFTTPPTSRLPIYRGSGRLTPNTTRGAGQGRKSVSSSTITALRDHLRPRPRLFEPWKASRAPARRWPL